jgi:hypothetical protein
VRLTNTIEYGHLALENVLAIAFGSTGLVSFNGFRRQSLTTPTWRKILNARLPRLSKTQRSAHAELEDKLARAEIINVAKLSGDTIKFGATVTLIEQETGEKKIWQIVGEPRSRAHKGKISVVSPIARALAGKSKGETIRGRSSRWR